MEEFQHIRDYALFRDIPLTPAKTGPACVKSREGSQQNKL